MAKFNKGSSIGSFLMLILALFLIGVFFWGDATITDDRTNELAETINQIDSPKMKEAFNELVKRDMDDGKITNDEYLKLQEVFNGWKISKAAGQEEVYTDKILLELNPPLKTKAELEAQKEQENKSLTFYLYIGGFFAFLFSLFFAYRIRNP